tara:strand:+ start:1336 stop:1872 length:537 start_codon:yes stop_codon:yes gene_type:complete
MEDIDIIPEPDRVRPSNLPVIRQWIEDLRSGEYAQGEGCLVNVEGKRHEFCCLGVLCDQAVLNGSIEWNAGKKSPGYSSLFESHAVRKFAGLAGDEVSFWADKGRRRMLLYVPLQRNPLVSLLPKVTRNTFGHSARHLFRGVECFAVEISDLNDVHHLNFNQIANLLEFNFILNPKKS